MEKAFKIEKFNEDNSSEIYFISENNILKQNSDIFESIENINSSFIFNLIDNIANELWKISNYE